MGGKETPSASKIALTTMSETPDEANKWRTMINCARALQCGNWLGTMAGRSACHDELDCRRGTVGRRNYAGD
jgi:hypothetical protein